MGANLLGSYFWYGTAGTILIWRRRHPFPLCRMQEIWVGGEMVRRGVWPARGANRAESAFLS